MMTRRQYLLTCLAEEAVEVAQRATKAARFGLYETQPDQPFNNHARLEQELGDLMGVCDMLGIKPDAEARAAKEARVEKYLAYSAGLGRVEKQGL